MCVCARCLQPWNHCNQDHLEHSLAKHAISFTHSFV
jgi:hypothetical protein